MPSVEAGEVTRLEERRVWPALSPARLLQCHHLHVTRCPLLGRSDGMLAPGGSRECSGRFAPRGSTSMKGGLRGQEAEISMAGGLSADVSLPGGPLTAIATSVLFQGQEVRGLLLSAGFGFRLAGGSTASPCFFC